MKRLFFLLFLFIISYVSLFATVNVKVGQTTTMYCTASAPEGYIDHVFFYFTNPEDANYVAIEYNSADGKATLYGLKAKANIKIEVAYSYTYTGSYDGKRHVGTGSYYEYITVEHSLIVGTPYKAKSEEGEDMWFVLTKLNNEWCVSTVANNKTLTCFDKMSVEGKVTIPSTVQGFPVRMIAGNSFYFCTGITEVVIPSTVQEIGKNSFLDCYSLETVTCLNPTPPIDNTPSSGKYKSSFGNYPSSTLYVPKGSKSKYEAAAGWKEFSDIREIGSDGIVVSNIKLDCESKTLSIGDYLQLTATVTPSNATDNTYTWSSSNVNVATVSEHGYVIAKAIGKATITCEANDGSGVRATCSITVNDGQVEPTSISLPNFITIKVGNTETISPTISPSDASTTITWTSDDKTIATVSSSGIVKGIKAGTTKVWATTSNGKTDYCNVTVENNVIEPTSISLPSSKTVKVGESFTMSYTLNPSNATTTLTWTSDDSSIASVSSSGVVKGVKAGSTYINVKTANGKTDYCKVTVEPSQNGITNVSFVSLTCDNTNLCKLKNSDVIKAHLTIKNTGESGVVQTYVRAYDDNDESSKYWHASSVLSKIVFNKDETKTIDFEISLQNVKKGSYYLAMCYFSDKNQEWYYDSSSLKKISIVDDFDLKGDGTRKNPYNSAAANAYVASLTPNVPTTEYIYVKGKVASVYKDYSNKRATLYISEDGTNKNRFCVFGAYYSWDDYNSGKLPSVGDEILVKGVLVYYLGNIPETSDNNSYILPNKDSHVFDSKAIVLSSAGYATFYDSKSAYTLPNGLSAQIVTDCSNNKLTYKTIADGSVSGVIPKGTAVMLVSDSKSAGTFTLTPYDSESIEKVSLWKNGEQSTIPAPDWSGEGRFASIAHKSGEETYAFSKKEWDIIKNEEFCVLIECIDNPNVRITSGWWSTAYGGSDFNSFELAKNNGDGTCTIVLKLSNYPNLQSAIDEQHLLFTGTGYKLLEIFQQKNAGGSATAPIIGTNYLHGSDESTTTSTSGNNYYYKLTFGDKGTENSNIFGWYWGAQNGDAFKIEGHKAWLALPKSAVTRSAFGIDATDIDGVDVEPEEDKYYDLQGRRISTPITSGIYIVNGKKVYIKK